MLRGVGFACVLGDCSGRSADFGGFGDSAGLFFFFCCCSAGDAVTVAVAVAVAVAVIVTVTDGVGWAAASAEDWLALRPRPMTVALTAATVTTVIRRRARRRDRGSYSNEVLQDVKKLDEGCAYRRYLQLSVREGVRSSSSRLLCAFDPLHGRKELWELEVSVGSAQKGADGDARDQGHTGGAPPLHEYKHGGEQAHGNGHRTTPGFSALARYKRLRLPPGDNHSICNNWHNGGSCCDPSPPPVGGEPKNGQPRKPPNKNR